MKEKCKDLGKDIPNKRRAHEKVWYICEMARKPSTHIMQTLVSHCWGLDFTLKRDGKTPGIGTKLEHVLTSVLRNHSECYRKKTLGESRVKQGDQFGESDTSPDKR